MEYNKGSTEALVQELLAQLRAFSSDGERLDEAIAAHFGVARSDARCMDVLSQHGRMGVGELAAAVGLSSPAVSALLDRMERAGYVERIHDTADRRRVVVVPTPKAAQEAGLLFAGLIEDCRLVAESYSDDQLRLITGFLDRIRAVLRDRAKGIAASEPGGSAGHQS
ncbi:MAG: MarR family transcriptional regulator [Chloroflexi bacterium]|nr:MarR family transcriptional regulator [Chloroflexota bacterium]